MTYLVYLAGSLGVVWYWHWGICVGTPVIVDVMPVVVLAVPGASYLLLPFRYRSWVG